MIEQLLPYIPLAAKDDLIYVLNKHPFKLKIVNGRKTKRGDFRATSPLPSITINNDLSKEQFLITLVHEIAHLHNYINYPRSKAHGVEWKQCFQHLMLPFLTSAIFKEKELLSSLAKHLINPKATTDSDTKLSVLLQKTEMSSLTNNCFIFELQPETIFTFNNRTFKLLNKRRTRYECLELQSKKRYLIKGNTPIQRV